VSLSGISSANVLASISKVSSGTHAEPASDSTIDARNVENPFTLSDAIPPYRWLCKLESDTVGNPRRGIPLRTWANAFPSRLGMGTGIQSQITRMR